MRSTNRCAILVLAILGVMNLNSQSMNAKVEQERSGSGIREITIKHSGFLSKKELVIRYRESDLQIVEVIDNGEKMPSEEFYRYESMLQEVVDHDIMVELAPKFERIEERLDSEGIPDSIKVEELEAMLTEIDSLYPDLSLDQRERLRVRIDRRILSHRFLFRERRVPLPIQVQTIRLKIRLKIVRRILQGMGLVSGDEEVTIKFRKGKCSVNGKKLSPEQTEEIKAIWEKHGDRPIDDRKFTIVF